MIFGDCINCAEGLPFKTSSEDLIKNVVDCLASLCNNTLEKACQHQHLQSLSYNSFHVCFHTHTFFYAFSPFKIVL